MPHLKDLDCSIELSDSQRKLQEFGTNYGDGFVETFVPVPIKPQSFSIHLTSEKFIAPGISMYVFVDGVYQCNRNRQDLKLRKASDSRSLVDFRVRQKEEKQGDGSMIAREWKFEKLDTASADDAPDVCSSNILDNIGCIEVLVLRCAGPRTAKTVSALHMDGASDVRPPNYGLDGQSDGRSMYDDRLSFFNSQGNAFGPPPPIPSYRTPYAETVRSHDTTSRSHHGTHSTNKPPPFFSAYQQRPHSHFSEPISPGARPPSIPSEAYQYGSGPIPTGPMVGSEKSFYHTHPASVAGTNAPVVDSKWLNEVLTEAVKRGVEESRREGAPIQTSTQWQHNHHGVEKDHGTTWGGSQGWGGSVAHGKGSTHVNWETSSDTESWSRPVETQSDTWDTEDTRGTGGQRSSQWSRSKAPTPHPKSSRWPDSVATHTQKSRHGRGDGTRKTHPKSRSRASKWDEGPSSSSEDRNGWTHVEATPDSPTSWDLTDDTLQPSQSRSQLRGSKSQSRSRKPSVGTQSARSKDKKSLRRSLDAVPSAASVAVPTTMNMPSTNYTPWHPPQVPPRRPSRNTELTPSNAPPPPIWGSTPSEKPRKHSSGATTAPPAPFSVAGNGFMKSAGARSTSSSSWSDANKPPSNEHTKASPSKGWGDEPGEKQDSWAIDPPSHETQFGGGWGESDTGGVTEGQWGFSNAPADGWNVGASGWDVDNTSKVDKQQEKEPTLWCENHNGWDNKNDADTAWPTENDAWGNNTNKADKSAAVQWDNTAWPSAPAEDKPPKAASTSKRHTSKSLSKYRQYRPTASDVGPKPHWQFPPSPSSKKLRPISENASLPPEPLLKVSSKQASEKGVDHQVRAGSGTQYGHVVGRPEYLDTLDKPYAVFRFKYRSRSILKSMFGDEVPDHGHLSIHTSSSKVKKEKEKLKVVSKDELIEKMLKLQTKLAEKGERRRDSKHKEMKAPSVNTESVARGLTENWVNQHSREASEKGKDK
ncbi:hypothetical protein CC86DRAFT_314922, partial [Ophiobolus disseminans]